MRVVGGEWGSRRLKTPADRSLRPTSDRLRETLFDILGPAVAGAAFVDGFAGTGAVGIEAFSRGARPVIWIEGAATAARLLRANLAGLGAAADPNAVVLERRLPAAVAALARLPALQEAGGAQFVFLDPPYADTGVAEQTLLELHQYPEVLAPGGHVIWETAARSRLPERIGRWHVQRQHRQGDSQLVFFESAY